MNRTIVRAALAAFAASFLCVVATTAAPTVPRYHLANLGTLGASSFASAALAINTSGEIAGWSYPPIANSNSDPIIDINGVMTDIGHLPGTMNGIARGVNDVGQVVGFNDFDGSTSRAFLYSGGSMASPGTAGDYSSIATGINNSGTVVGYLVQTSAQTAPTVTFLYSNGNLTTLGTLGGSSSHGMAINASGQVTGYSDVASNNHHAFLYNGSSMVDLGTLGGNNSFGEAINTQGEVVGNSYLSDNMTDHAFIYNNGVMQDIGALLPLAGNSFANGVNDLGEVIGVSQNSGGFIYSGGTMYNLWALLDSSANGWTILDLKAINDSGWIAGIGQFQGKSLAVLLTPVPEPSSLILLAFGGLGLLWRVVRAQRRV